MNWPLLRLSLRARLYAISAVVILLLLMPSYYGLRQLGALRDIAFDLKGRHSIATLNVGRLQAELSELDRLQRNYVSAPSSETSQQMFSALEEARLHVTRLEEAGYVDGARVEGARLDTLAAATARIDSLMQRGARRGASAEYAALRDHYDRAGSALTLLAQTIDTRSTEAAVRAQEISQRAARSSAFATGIAAGLAVLLALLSVGALTAPLGRLRSAMAAVAGGRFLPPRDLPYGRTDEIGDLTRSFRSMTERLAELDRLKAEFVSIASHELKTPVNVINGYIEMIEDGSYGETDERQLEVLGYVREQTQVLRERVDQLLAMSRLEAQGIEVEANEVRVEDLMEEVRRNFAGVAAQKRIVFRSLTEPSAPQLVRLDLRRVRDELLGNLLTNAFKFTPRGGAIDLKAMGEPGWLVLQLRDTGEGIPEGELPYIFEKYYQAGHHAGKVGAGLGLAIAREIVEAHGGMISVESRQGVGTTFRVELPVEAHDIESIDVPRGLRRRAESRGAAVGAEPPPHPDDDRKIAGSLGPHSS